MTHNLKKIALLGTVLIAPAFAFAQEVAAATPAPEPPVMSLHLILGLIAVFMLFPVIVTGRTFLLAVNVYVQKVKKESDALKKAGVVALLMLSSQFADASSLGINAGPEPTDWLACILTGVIVFEFILFFYFSTQIKNFLSLQVKPEAIEETALTEPSKDWLEEVWDKLNSFKPLSEEANIDTGHSYDGIRELDNVTPPWFLAGFALSIVFSFTSSNATLATPCLLRSKSTPQPWPKPIPQRPTTSPPKAKRSTNPTSNSWAHPISKQAKPFSPKTASPATPQAAEACPAALVQTSPTTIGSTAAPSKTSSKPLNTATPKKA